MSLFYIGLLVLGFFTLDHWLSFLYTPSYMVWLQKRHIGWGPSRQLLLLFLVCSFMPWRVMCGSTVTYSIGIFDGAHIFSYHRLEYGCMLVWVWASKEILPGPRSENEFLLCLLRNICICRDDNDMMIWNHFPFLRFSSKPFWEAFIINSVTRSRY